MENLPNEDNIGCPVEVTVYDDQHDKQPRKFTGEISAIENGVAVVVNVSDPSETVRFPRG